MTRRTRIKFGLLVLVASQLGCSSITPVITPSGCVIFGQVGTGGPVIGIPIPFNLAGLQAKAVLTGTEAVPPADTQATGQASLTLNEDGSELAYELTASGLSSPLVEASFRIAPAGSQGAVALDITDQAVGSDDQVTITGTWPIHPVDLQAVQRGNLYVELCTELHPEGELRGQVQPEPTEQK